MQPFGSDPNQSKWSQWNKNSLPLLTTEPWEIQHLRQMSNTWNKYMSRSHFWKETVYLLTFKELPNICISDWLMEGRNQRSKEEKQQNYHKLNTTKIIDFKRNSAFTWDHVFSCLRVHGVTVHYSKFPKWLLLPQFILQHKNKTYFVSMNQIT